MTKSNSLKNQLFALDIYISVLNIYVKSRLFFCPVSLTRMLLILQSVAVFKIAVYFYFYHFLDCSTKKILQFILYIFRYLDIIFLQELVDNISFSSVICTLYAIFFSCHNIIKGLLNDNLFYHRRPYTIYRKNLIFSCLLNLFIF